MIRNKVKRRLRAIVSDVMPQLPPQSSLVIRALPASASASFERLRDDVTSALESAMAKAVA